MQESVKNNLASDMEEGNSFIILYYISTSMVNSEANNPGDGRVVCDKLYEHIYDDRLWLREKGEKRCDIAQSLPVVNSVSQLQLPCFTRLITADGDCLTVVVVG